MIAATRLGAIWANPIRWPQNAMLDIPGRGNAQYVFFARAAAELQDSAGEQTDRLVWACERLVEAAADGNLRLALAYPGDEWCSDVPGQLFSDPAVVDDYIHECRCYDTADLGWLFVHAGDLAGLLQRAGAAAVTRQPVATKAKQSTEARKASEAKAEQDLSALAESFKDDPFNAPKRDDWVAQSTLTVRVGRSVWNRVATNYPVLSSKGKTKG